MYSSQYKYFIIHVEKSNQDSLFRSHLDTRQISATIRMIARSNKDVCLSFAIIIINMLLLCDSKSVVLIRPSHTIVNEIRDYKNCQ
jgi:hypothetical protein